MISSAKRLCFVDVETYSEKDIKAGAYAYANDPAFEILLVGYSLDGENVKVFSPRKFSSGPQGSEAQIRLSLPEPDPAELGLDGDEDEFLAALKDPEIVKIAHNANFERTTLGKYYGDPCDPDSWLCTAVLATTVGLPRSLAGAGAALKLPEDKQKDKIGKKLIEYFCKPVRATKTNGGRTRNYPRHDPEKWKLFIQYNRDDVVAEIAIFDRLRKYLPNDFEQRLWSVDQIICDRGIRIDRSYVEGIVEWDESRQQELKEEAKRISGLDNPGSVAQLKRWFAGRGETLLSESLSKDNLAWALSRDHPPAVRRMLEIRQALRKTSTKKYAAMLNSACDDDRVRGMLQFYGASRTGRWAGRIVQLQNLPQNHIPDLDLARSLVAAKDFDALELLYGEPAPVFSELVRTAFIPSDGCRFVVSDFSAIEARVIAWLSGEDWRLDVFKNGGDIYCASASQMFKVPVEKHGQNAHLRQKGKIAELALGYGGGVGAMKSMDKAGAIPEDDLPEIVSKWRAASPKIVALWKTYEKAAKRAIEERRVCRCKLGVAFYFADGILFARLPSGRSIAYWDAKIDEATNEIVYKGIDANKNWGLLKTYGGKLVENVVQATARDCLAVKLVEATELGYEIVAHVHDEMIIDAPLSDPDAAAKIDALMAEPIAWADGLPLKGGTYECSYYQKD